MFRTIQPVLFAFDLEWIPDPRAAEILHGQGPVTDARGAEDAMRAHWRAAGATPEHPRPWVKTILCRIVSAAGVLREATPEGPQLRLISLPADPADPAQAEEGPLLNALLKSLGRRRPQLVGYNSVGADVAIIVQRAVVHGLSSHGFAARPEKPWEGNDYFSPASEGHIDLAPLLGRFRETPSLHEAATLCGIPGKIDTAGAAVPELWLQGRLPEIVAYNECDALTTYLLWARTAHFIGLLNAESYALEQRLVRELVERGAAAGQPHLQKYLRKWDELAALQARPHLASTRPGAARPAPPEAPAPDAF